MESSHENQDQPWWRDSVLLFSRLSGWIGVPVVLALFLGKWLDQRYGTKPWLLLVCVGASFILSSVGIVREAREAMEKIANSEKENSKPEKEKSIKQD
jgi:F0F1-type ATP synthase assembly protein I